MDLFQEKLLRTLSSKYGFELAGFKQQTGGDFPNKLERYETLTYYHLNRLFTSAINEYIINNTHQDPKKLYSSVVYLLFQISGDILKQVDKSDEKEASKILRESLSLIKKTRKGKGNERFDE